MSADNWGKCPKCKKVAEITLEKYEQKIEKSYGKVSRDEYELLKADAPSGDVEERTFREDYEIGVDEDGFFFVSYSGHCNICGFEYKEKYDKQVCK